MHEKCKNGNALARQHSGTELLEIIFAMRALFSVLPLCFLIFLYCNKRGIKSFSSICSDFLSSIQN